VASKRGGILVPIAATWNGGAVKRAESSLGKFVKTAGIAGAAAAAFAVKLGVDGVQAAIAEEQELAKLNKTLDNLGFAAAADEVSTFIDNMQYAANVADTDLRNAFGVLLRGTRDLDEAQRALGIALDVSAGSGKGLAETAQAMSRAYLGNTVGLSRLNAGIDKATLKTGDMVKITGVLKDTFGGASSAQANTLGGSIRGVQIAYDELLESFGSGVIGSTDDDVAELQKIEDKLRGMQPAAENLGEDVRNVGLGALTLYDRITAFSEAIEGQDWGQAFDMLAAGAKGADDEFDKVIRNFRSLDDIIPGVAMNTGGLNFQTENLGGSMDALAEDAEGATDALRKQKSAVDKLSGALDTLNGKNRSVAGARLALRRLREEGPTATGGKKGKVVTRDDKIDFALQYAQAAETLSTALADKGQTAAARKALQRGNQFVGGVVGDNMADNFLSTPAYLDRGNRGQRAAGQRMGTGETNNYYFSGTWMVANPEQVVEQQKRAKRLRALAGPQSVASHAAYGGYSG